MGEDTNEIGLRLETTEISKPIEKKVETKPKLNQLHTSEIKDNTKEEIGILQNEIKDLNHKTWLQTEQEKLRSDVTLLGETEGFKKLSEKQQRLIITSLYLQARAVRETDPQSVLAINHGNLKDFFFRKDTSISSEKYLNSDEMREQGARPEKRKYRISQNYISSWFCHPAILGLETGTLIDATPNSYPDGVIDDNKVEPFLNIKIAKEFFQADYKKVSGENELKERIEKFGFPCVIHIDNGDPSRYLSPIHSFLALGYNKENEIVVWDKKGIGDPFRVVVLNEICNQYRFFNEYYWGVRELKNRDPGTTLPEKNTNNKKSFLNFLPKFFKKAS